MLKYVTQIIWFLMAIDNYMVMILHDYYMIMDRYNHKYSWYSYTLYGLISINNYYMDNGYML